MMYFGWSRFWIIRHGVSHNGPTGLSAQRISPGGNNLYCEFSSLSRGPEDTTLSSFRREALSTKKKKKKKK